jgi:hypothetical protein
MLEKTSTERKTEDRSDMQENMHRECERHKALGSMGAGRATPSSA